MNEEVSLFHKPTVVKLRKQVPITVLMCCEDFYLKFDPLDWIRTQLGWGEIEEATYEDPIDKLTITLLHD